MGLGGHSYRLKRVATVPNGSCDAEHRGRQLVCSGRYECVLAFTALLRTSLGPVWQNQYDASALVILTTHERK